MAPGERRRGGTSATDEGSSFARYKLPHGRHGLPRELVEENQRWRLLGAAGEVVAEHGYAGTTARAIAIRAGVSSVTFYGYFDNLGQCLLAAYEMAADCLCDIVSGACKGRGEWPERLRAALVDALELLAAEPGLAALLGAAVPAGDAAIAAARDRLLSRLAWQLRGGRELRKAGAPALAADTERRLVAAVLGLVSERVVAGDVDRLPALAPELAAVLAASYLPAPAGRSAESAESE